MKQNNAEIEIKVDQLNAECIEEQLNLLQQGTWERQLKYSDVYSATLLADIMLDNIIGKLNRQNIIAIVKPAFDPYTINYRGLPKETRCKIKRKKDGWYLIKVERVIANRRGSFRLEIDKNSIVNKTEDIIKYLSNSLKW